MLVVVIFLLAIADVDGVFVFYVEVFDHELQGLLAIYHYCV